MERKNGYLLLEEVNLKRTSLRDNNEEMAIIQIGDQEYYFKECNKQIALLNMFCVEVAKSLDIPTIEYDLAVYNHKKGIIAKNYNPNSMKEITILDILKDYYIHLIDEELADEINNFNDLYSLDIIWESLEYRYKNNEIVKKLMDEIIDSFLLQIFIGNQDLHYKNISIIENEEPYLVPNYDYDQAFLVEFEHQFFPYALEGFYREKSISGKRNPEDVINELLNSSDETFQNKLSDKLTKLLTKEDILKILSMKLNIDVEKVFPKFYLRNYDSYKQYINMIMETVSNSIKR